MNSFFKNLSRRQIEQGLYALVLTIVAFCVCMTIWNSGELWAKLWAMLCTVIGPFAYAIMLSYMLKPMVARIESGLARSPRLSKAPAGTRGLATLIMSVIVVILVLAVLAGLVIVVADGVPEMGWKSVMEMYHQMTTDFTGFLAAAQKQLMDLGIVSQGFMDSIATTFVDVTFAFTTIMFTITFTIFFLIDGEHIFTYSNLLVHKVLGEHALDTAQFLDDADRVFSSYFRGQATDALVLSLLTTAGLSLVQVPHAPVVGLLAGLGNLLPYTGGPVGLVATAAVCVIDGNFAKLPVGLAVMGILAILDLMVIGPKLLAGCIMIHPMVVGIALFVGGTLGGIPGIIIAIPLAAWIKIQVDRWVGADEQPPDQP